MAEPTSTISQLVEQWKPVVGFEGTYSVSDQGNIRRDRGGANTRSGKILLQEVMRLGYRRVGLGTTRADHRRILVHVLVAEAFIGPRPDGCNINHKDCDKGNNAASNLEYVTPARNSQHAHQHRLRLANKLGPDEINQIRKLLASGLLQREIAAQFGVCRVSISLIKNQKRWGHVAYR